MWIIYDRPPGFESRLCECLEHEGTDISSSAFCETRLAMINETLLYLLWLGLKLFAWRCWHVSWHDTDTTCIVNWLDVGSVSQGRCIGTLPLTTELCVSFQAFGSCFMVFIFSIINPILDLKYCEFLKRIGLVHERLSHQRNFKRLSTYCVHFKSFVRS